MKIVMRNWFVLVLCLQAISSWAQPYYVRLKSADGEFLPNHIEKVVTVEKSDTCRVERVHIFKEWGNPIDSAEWRFCNSNGTINISRNGNLIHSFPLKECEIEGRLSLVKTRLKIQFISDTLNKARPYWYISDLMDKRYTLKYDANNHQIIASTEPYSQRYLLSGFIFDDIPQTLSGKALPGFNETLFKSGDSLQIGYFSATEGSERTKKMKQLNTYHVTYFDSTAEFPTWRIASEIYDTENEIAIQQDTIVVSQLPDGIMLGNNMTLPYNFLKEGMYCIEPREEIWRLYLLPLLDVDKPNIELFYDTSISIGNKSVTAYRYWNSVLPYRLSWVSDFPLPVQEFESIRAEPVFIKSNGNVFGSRINVKEPSLPAIRYFDEQKASLFFRFHVTQKGVFRVRLFDASQQEVSLDKKDFKLKGGIEEVTLSAANKQPDADYLVKWYRVDGDKEVLLKEFIFHSRYFQ